MLLIAFALDSCTQVLLPPGTGGGEGGVKRGRRGILSGSEYDGEEHPGDCVGGHLGY